MRVFCCCLAILFAATVVAVAQQSDPAATKNFTLTIQVEGTNSQGGNIGVLVFNSDKGWAEDRSVALRDIVVPAHPGTVTVEVPDLPAGDYAVALIHDVNKNHKIDRNFIGVPKEQWGMSNNPHAHIKAPSFATARFSLKGNQEIHVQLQ